MWKWLVENAQPYPLVSALATFLAIAVALAIPLTGALVRWWKRPILTIDFGNRPRWRRHVPVDGPDGANHVGLFFRVRVTNVGRRPTSVSGRLVEIRLANGEEDLSFDPLTLHWTGTEHGAGTRGSIELLPGQSELLDVLRVGVFEGHQFVIDAQDQSPRGVALGRPVAGQALTVTVSGTDAAGVGIELRLPAGPLADLDHHLQLDYRPLGTLGPPHRWKHDPPVGPPADHLHWAVSKDDKWARCVSRTYPFGRQLRLYANDEPFALDKWFLLPLENDATSWARNWLRDWEKGGWKVTEKEPGGPDQG